MTMTREWFIDANLLVLLVVGITDRSLISKHRRLRTFTSGSYDRLIALVGQNRIHVTPNTLTEASNLIGQHEEPERSQCYDTLSLLVKNSNEIFVESATAIQNKDFRRLGLSDAVLLEVVSPETPLLTVDFELYLAASRASAGASAINFRHLDPQ